jgi:hypothetical protein
MISIKRLWASLIMFAFITTASFYFSGCGEDNIVQPQEEHFEPEGLLIKPEGLPDTLVHYFQGAFINGKDNLSIAAGDTSAHLDIDFLNSNQVEIQPGSSGYSLDWAVANTMVADIFSDEPWAFHVIGITADTTSFSLKVLHNGHADFTTLPIRINVTP